MSRFQTKNKVGDKVGQVKKTKNCKIVGINTPLCDKQNFLDKQLPNSVELESTPVCANCSGKMNSENSENVKSSKEKVNELLITEKPRGGTFIRDNDFDIPVSLLQLPQLNFLNKKPSQEDKLRQPKISDLCVEDRQRIVQLIEEVARYKMEKQDNINDINLLRSQLQESCEKIATLKASESEKLKSLKKLEAKHKEEENTLKAKLSELSSLLVEMHRQKEITNDQVKAVKFQADKLTEALQNVHNEKLTVEQLYLNTKEELKLAKYANDKLAKEMAVIKEKKVEEKGCQCSEEEPVHEKKGQPTEDTQHKAREEIKLEREIKPAGDTHDFQILSELFFSKTSISHQNESLQIVQGHIANKYVSFGDIFIE